MRVHLKRFFGISSLTKARHITIIGIGNRKAQHANKGKLMDGSNHPNGLLGKDVAVDDCPMMEASYAEAKIRQPNGASSEKAAQASSIA